MYRLRTYPASKTGTLSYHTFITRDFYPPADEPYSQLLYLKYCPKASFTADQGVLDINHAFTGELGQVCERCGFDKRKTQDFAPDPKHAAEHLKAALTFREPKPRYSLKQPMNTAVAEAIEKLYSRYKA